MASATWIFLRSGNKSKDEAALKILKEQLNWDEMFEGKDHLKGDKPEKEDGMEAILNLALGPFRLMNPRELEQVVLEKTTGGPLHSFLASDYKALSFTVKLLQHPRALPYMGRMVDQRHKFYFFIGFVIFTMIGFYMYRRSKFKGRTFVDTFFQRIFLFIFAMTIRLGVLVLLFYKELTPIYQLGSTHFN